MSTRKQLISELSTFQPFNDEEKRDVEKTIAFLKTEPKAFMRESLQGHITASAFIVDECGNNLLLTHHLKLDKWIQLGGHCDGEENTLAVAQREIQEESGLREVVVEGGLFDVSIQVIPMYKGIPEHLHYDIRYLFKANKTAPLSRQAVESKELRWIPIDQLHTLWANPHTLSRIRAKLYSRIQIESRK